MVAFETPSEFRLCTICTMYNVHVYNFRNKCYYNFFFYIKWNLKFI